MDYDLLLTIGLIVGVFAIPAAISAISESRAPRVASLAIIIAGGLVAYSVTQKPGGYRFDEIPNVLVNVIARFIG